MKINEKNLHFAVEALAEVLTFRHPADAVLSHFFRQEKSLGSQDRAFVAETVYAILRRKRSLERYIGENPTARRLVLASLVKVMGLSSRQLADLIKPAEKEWLATMQAEPETPPSLGDKADMPDWLTDRLLPVLGEEGLLALARSLSKPAPLDLRANPIKMDRDKVLASLRADGIEAEEGAWSPVAIRLKGKPALQKHALFLAGAFEVQDEGSQLLGYLLQPKRGEMVVDFCAGAGGKTLLLGALMRSTGRLYAFDVSDKRLAKLKPRAARSGLSNIHPVLIDSERDAKVKRLAGKIDRVLVDAPCSGLGTLRRNPDLKWRQNEESIAELTAKQAAILDSAARLVRPGGRLVYATCSILPEENGAIVDAFLVAHPDFKRLSAREVLASQGIKVDIGEDLQLLPQQHGTDGFFAAVMERGPKVVVEPAAESE